MRLSIKKTLIAFVAILVFGLACGDSSGPEPAEAAVLFDVFDIFESAADSLTGVISWTYTDDGAGLPDDYTVTAKKDNVVITGFPKNVTQRNTSFTIAQIPYGTSATFSATVIANRRGLPSPEATTSIVYSRTDVAPQKPDSLKITITG